MFNFMIPGLFIAIGIAGLVWTVLNRFSSLAAAKVDTLAILAGLAAGFVVSLALRGLLRQPMFVLASLAALAATFMLTYAKSRPPRAKHQEKKAPFM